ncbi:hypothetical protein ACFOKJ_04610 [Vogesella amnigena]|uniref:GH16 domain-containing protein n=1 Tax=Vogesella amnigena TaxID=1507449 RepID=A0ABV7TRS0_9NEIS
MLRKLAIATFFSLIITPALSASREIAFSGYNWEVRDSAGKEGGPGPNIFDGTPESVAVGADGSLHLFIRKTGNIWTSSEVILSQALGYGTYELEVETNPTTLPRSVVFGFFTYKHSPEQAHRELDVELSYWGKPNDVKNGQFVVQNDTTPGRVTRFTVNEAHTRYRIRWTKGLAEFIALSSAGNILQHWTRREGVPDADGAKIELNLWLYKGQPPQAGDQVELVVKNFRFTPE